MLECRVANFTLALALVCCLQVVNPIAAGLEGHSMAEAAQAVCMGCVGRGLAGQDLRAGALGDAQLDEYQRCVQVCC